MTEKIKVYKDRKEDRWVVSFGAAHPPLRVMSWDFALKLAIDSADFERSTLRGVFGS